MYIEPTIMSVDWPSENKTTISKAFDRVPHQRLLTKLRSHGIGDSTAAWIEAWLSDRQQTWTSMNVGLLNLFISYTYVLPKPRNDTLTGTSLNNELLDYSISGSLTITVCCLKKQFQRGTNYQNSKTIYVNHTRTRSSDFWKHHKNSPESAVGKVFKGSSSRLTWVIMDVLSI